MDIIQYSIGNLLFKLILIGGARVAVSLPAIEFSFGNIKMNNRLVNSLLFGENVRLVDRILFPEMFPENDNIFDNEEHDIFERRQYRLLNRRLVNDYTDTDFFARFRVTKPFFYLLLDEIAADLAQDDTR